MNKLYPGPFEAKALATVPRALGLCDRLDSSATYGCCDRYFWHYRLIDFANGRFQEAGLLFALAATAASPQNPFHSKSRLIDWSRAAWRFWLNIRNKDGSVAELYPHERCFCATSFGLAAMVETVKVLGGAAGWESELRSAHATAKWLTANSAPKTSNQMAASFLALWGQSVLTGDAELSQQARSRFEQLVGQAEPDGILPEYGGYDAGYQSITLSLLARALDWGFQDRRLDDLLSRGVELLERSMQEDGSLTAEKNSRRTQFIYPYALAAAKSPALDRLAQGLAQDRVVNPLWMDDRYCLALAADYFFTSRELRHADEHR